MDQSSNEQLVRKLSVPSVAKIFGVVVVLSLIAGTGTGFILAKTGEKSSSGTITSVTPGNAPPKSAQQDNQTFRDFAEGVIQNKPSPKPGQKDYSEGSVLLQRQCAVPVALTSSVVDLSQYMGKKVKVYGETQKALEEGWLMDVGKVEVEQ